MPAVHRPPSSFRHNHAEPPCSVSHVSPEVTSIGVDIFLKSVSSIHCGKLVVRGGGLSFCDSVQLFLTNQDGETLLSSDNGFSISCSLIQSVVLVQSHNGPTRIEIEMVDSGESLTYYPREDLEERFHLEMMRENSISGNSDSQSSVDPKVISPEKWLNQDLHAHLEAWEHTLEVTGHPGQYRVQMRLESSGIALFQSFEVSFFDAEGGIFRLAAMGGETVLHLSLDHFTTKRIRNGISLEHSFDSFAGKTENFEDWISPAFTQ